jgi:hypothetical protein
VAQGFTVKAAALASGSEEVQTLQDRCVSLGSSATETMAGMAGAAGSAALVSALNGVAETALKTFLTAGAAYQHVGQGLTQSAQNYTAAENSNIENAEGVAGRFR